MSNKHQNYQKQLRYYKDETGEKDVDLRQLAAWMIKKGHKPPTPKTPVELLARELASALREETRYDKISGRPYRANHAFASGDLFTWFDIDEKPVRRKMHASLMKRREQMVGDGLQLSLDADHWNSENADQEAIPMPLDLELDVQIRKMAPPEKEAA